MGECRESRPGSGQLSAIGGRVARHFAEDGQLTTENPDTTYRFLAF